jgi:hypothetical protein
MHEAGPGGRHSGMDIIGPTIAKVTPSEDGLSAVVAATDNLIGRPQ